MQKENGGPAFAASGHPAQQHVQQEGMTLRDYFAAKAMITMGEPDSYVGTEETKRSYRCFANKAYKLADAMLEARNK